MTQQTILILTDSDRNSQPFCGLGSFRGSLHMLSKFDLIIYMGTWPLQTVILKNRYGVTGGVYDVSMF
jgi:hypothetical protein